MSSEESVPQTFEELNAKLDDALIRQEHRLFHILRNAWEYSSLDRSDPRRDAARSALLFRIVMALLPTAAVTGAGLVAFAGLYLAWQANSLIHEQNKLIREQTEERLTVKLNPYVNGQVRITDHDFGQEGRIVQFPWKLTISNSGQQKLSVVACDLYQGLPPNNSMQYTGIFGGLFSENMKRVSLPVVLDAGEAKEYYIYVGMMIPPKAFAKFPTPQDGQQLLDRDLSVSLAQEGIDVFGHPVDFKDDGGVMIKYLHADEAPLFVCALSTGRNNVASGAARKYTPMLP